MEKNIQTLLLDKLTYFKIFSNEVREKTFEAKNNKEISEEAQNQKIDSVLYNVETSYLFNELLTMIVLVKELGIQLPKEVAEFLSESADMIYKRRFAIEGGLIVEATEGALAEGRAKFLQSDMLKMINKNLE